MNLWEILAQSRGRNEKWLESKTREYWEKFKRSTQSDYNRWQHYLQETAVSEPDCSLFECEMAYAAHAKLLPELEADKAITLVILVGDSFEPLLQSVWAHNPIRLVPVVNTKYPDGSNGDAQWNAICVPLEMLLKRPSRHIEWKIDKLPTVKFDAPKDKKDCFKPVEDKPTAVFRFLEAHLKDDLKDPARRVIVDITGAKKTIVAGAFMLAAYSDTEICYVDSKKHHEGRPFGYACHFRAVDNPLKQLALQSWNNIEKLYTKGDYAHALAILNSAYPQREAGEAKQEGFQEIEHFRAYLRICAHWDEGDIQEAAEVMEAAKLPEALHKCVPVAVTKLKGLFPKANDSTLNLELFTQTDKIVIYAQDEIERVKRLIQKGASRAAFSRAYALYEGLFNFRVTMLFTEGALLAWPNQYLSKEKPKPDGKPFASNSPEESWYAPTREACSNMQSHQARGILRGEYQVTKYKSQKGRDKPICLTWNPEFRRYPLFPFPDIKPGQLRNKRNLITHSYFPTEENDAKKALQLARKNFRNYRKHWMNYPNQADLAQLSKLTKLKRFSVPPWETIRDEFRLQFIPVEKL